MNRGFEDFEAYFRLISDFKGVSTFRYHYGKLLVVPAPRRKAVDFVDYVSIKQDRTRCLPNGDYQHAYRGLTMFTDRRTGRVLDTVDNPYTGEKNTVAHFATSGGSIVYTPKGAYLWPAETDAPNPPKLSGGPVKFDWAHVGDDAWLTYPERFEIFDDEGNPVAADNSMYRYKASLAQLGDPSISNVDTVITWQTETGLWGWMNMKDHPGHCIIGGMGGKYAALGDLPKEYVKEAETRFPGHISTPIDWSDFILPAGGK